jgi:hypothetical protein
VLEPAQRLGANLGQLLSAGRRWVSDGCAYWELLCSLFALMAAQRARVHSGSVLSARRRWVSDGCVCCELCIIDSVS